MSTENNYVLTVDIGWDFDGFIELDVNMLHEDFKREWIMPYLTNSIPAILNQELCEMSFKKSLNLCNRLITFLSGGGLENSPIPPFLESAQVNYENINRIEFLPVPSKKYFERSNQYDDAVIQLIINFLSTVYWESTAKYKNTIKEYIVFTINNYLSNILPTFIKDGEVTTTQKLEILSKRDSFDLKLRYKLRDGFSVPKDEYEKLLDEVQLAYEGYKNQYSKPLELMSEVEKADFTLDYLLPSLEKAMIRDLENRGSPQKAVLKGHNQRQVHRAKGKKNNNSYRVASLEKTQKYMFAHVVLPMIFLGNPKDSYKKLRGPSSKQYLLDLWNAVGDKVGEKSSPVGLEVARKVSSDDKGIFIIKLPAPSLITEAHFVGVVFSITTSSVSEARYFTFELGANPYTDQEEHYFCEWIGVVNPKHKNYGRLPDKNIETFISAIKRTI